MDKRTFFFALTIVFVLAAGAANAAWVTQASVMPNPGAETVDGYYVNGKIYVIGGLDTLTFTWNGKTRIYDVATDTWTSGGSCFLR